MTVLSARFPVFSIINSGHRPSKLPVKSAQNARAPPVIPYETIQSPHDKALDRKPVFHLTLGWVKFSFMGSIYNEQQRIFHHSAVHIWPLNIMMYTAAQF